MVGRCKRIHEPARAAARSGATLQRCPHSSRPLMELPVRVYRKPITGVCPKNTGRANVYDERACASTPPRCVYIAYGCIVAHTRSHAMMQTRVEIISAFAFHRPGRATTSDPPAYRAHELFYEFRHVIKEAALISFRRVTHATDSALRALRHYTCEARMSERYMRSRARKTIDWNIVSPLIATPERHSTAEDCVTFHNS